MTGVQTCALPILYCTTMAENKKRSSSSGRPPKRVSGKRSPAASLWYADGLQFECAACGACCGGEPGYIWMDEAEIRQAADAMGMHVLDFCQMYIAEFARGFSLREKENGDCCMLKDGRCTMYEHRPVQCRTWPFWPSNLRSAAAWREAGERCPGINRGRRWSLAEIAARRDQMK